MEKSVQKSQRNSSDFNALSYYSQAVNKMTHSRFIPTMVMRLQFYLPLMSPISNHSTAALCISQNSQGQAFLISPYYLEVYCSHSLHDFTAVLPQTIPLHQRFTLSPQKGLNALHSSLPHIRKLQQTITGLPMTET